MIWDRTMMEEVWRSKQIVNACEIVVWDHVLRGPLNGCMPATLDRKKANMKTKPKKK